MVGSLYILIFICRTMITLKNDFNNILLEWAMLSEDGLLSGYRDPRSIEILKQLLKERNIDPKIAEDIVSDVINSNVAEQSKSDEFNEVDSVISKVQDNEKDIQAKFIPPLIEVLREYPSFAVLYSSAKSIDESINLYNAHYSGAIKAINNRIRDKGLGKGELAFVFLLEDCKSGGQASGDLLYKGKKIDVKQLDPASEVLITYNSYATNYRSLNFSRAITKLASFVESDVDAKDILISLVEGKPLKNGLTSKNAEPFNSNETKYVSNFLDKLNIDEMGGSVFTGLEKLGRKLNSIEVAKEPPVDCVSFIVNEKKTDLMVLNAQEILSKIGNNPELQSVSIRIAAFRDKVAQFTLPALKKLDFFYKGMNNDTITSELVSQLHYDGIIVIDNDESNPVYLPKTVKNNLTTFSDNTGLSFKFSRLTKGTKFRLVNTTEPLLYEINE